MTFPILGGNGAITGAYSIDNSLRFNDGDSAYLSRTQTAGNRRTWTWSGWIKRGVVDTRQNILSAGIDGNDESQLRFDATGYLRFKESTGNSPEFTLDTNALFRDSAAWYHIVVAVDTTQSTDSDRIKIYKNGSQITSFNSPNYPSQNYETRWNNNSQTTYLGLNVPAYPDYFDGYFAETYFIDGTQLQASDFGEFDTDSGIWKPKAYSGSYGTNGFYLPFNNIGQTHNITAYGDVHHETDAQKIGATSIEFDGTGDYLSLDDKSQFKFGSGDFTIEFFAKMGDQANTYTTLFNDPDGGNKLRVDTGGSTTAPKLSFYSSAWDERTSGTTDLSDNAWHHCAIVRDNGNLRIFVDGTQEATRASSTQDVDSSGVFEIGRYNGGTRYFDGYLDEIRISNVARYTGSFTPTTSAFTKDDNTRLLIHSNSSDGNTTFTDDSGSDGGIGDDASGNNNDFTTTNINDFTDQMLDTPTKNFNTLSPLAGQMRQNGHMGVLSQGNLQFTPSSSTGWSGSSSNFLIPQGSGKWYAETVITYVSNQSGLFGIQNAHDIRTHGYFTAEQYSVVWQDSGDTYIATVSSGTETNKDTSIDTSVGDIYQIAYDSDNGKIWFGRNNTWITGNPSTDTSPAYSSITGDKIIYSASYRSSSSYTAQLVNFGQDSSFAGNKTAQNNSDANGEGDFYYTPPSGFLALNSTNLATALSPTIDDPSAHFQVKLYSGNNTQTAITYDGNSNLQPDLIWAKSRSNAHYHDWRDTSRGLTKRLYSNGSNAEDTKSASYVSFDSNGFTLGDDGGGSPANTVNSSGNNYASWGWKANGGTTSSNTDGSITSTVQANTTAGFSIVTFTGTTSNQSVGHGLNQAPEIFFAKSRVSTANWNTYTSVIDGSLDFLFLNTTDAKGNASNSLPTSSVIYQNQTDSSVAYCFHSVEGYSKIGSYTGNGSTDGTFVYTGFRPAFVMIKRIDATNHWGMADNKRDAFNLTDEILLANSSGTGYSGSGVGYDMLSNGFKIRNSDTIDNASGGSYVYFAFAENPFVTSSGVPVTAR